MLLRAVSGLPLLPVLPVALVVHVPVGLRGLPVAAPLVVPGPDDDPDVPGSWFLCAVSGPRFLRVRGGLRPLLLVAGPLVVPESVS